MLYPNGTVSGYLERTIQKCPRMLRTILGVGKTGLRSRSRCRAGGNAKMTDAQPVIDKWKGVTSQSSRPLQPGNRVNYLIDGWATFSSMHEAIATTLAGDPDKYFIYLLGWWLDDDFPLEPTSQEKADQKGSSSSFYALMQQ